jgi:hypothetical protein
MKARMKPAGRAFGAPEDELREIRDCFIVREKPGLRCAPSGLCLLWILSQQVAG